MTPIFLEELMESLILLEPVRTFGFNRQNILQHGADTEDFRTDT